MRAYVLAGRPDTEGDVAELVSLHVACAKYKALPRPGGVLDQPARLMYMLEQVVLAYAEKEQHEAARMKAEAAAQAHRR